MNESRPGNPPAPFAGCSPPLTTSPPSVPLEQHRPCHSFSPGKWRPGERRVALHVLLLLNHLLESSIPPARQPCKTASARALPSGASLASPGGCAEIEQQRLAAKGTRG